MALLYTTNILSAHRDAKLSNGMRIAEMRVTVGATTDYATGVGLLLAPAGAGFRKLAIVMPQTWKTSGGTVKFAQWYFDEATNRLRGVKAAPTGSSTIPTELVQGDFAAGDTIDCLVLGT